MLRHRNREGTEWDLKFHSVQSTKEASSVAYICAMSYILAFRRRANRMQDLASYHGPELHSHLLFTTMNNKAVNNKARGEKRGANHLALVPPYRHSFTRRSSRGLPSGGSRAQAAPAASRGCPSESAMASGQGHGDLSDAT